MLFASDLDRTLIYSRKAFGSPPLEHIQHVRLIETLDGREISFMTESAIASLKRICEQVLFVPVTTRTIEQYLRIRLFQGEIQPIYAITSNGGNILFRGQLDEEWRKRIENRLKHDCLPIQDILIKFEEIKSPSWLISEKTADDLFYYCVVKKQELPINELHSFNQWAKENHWNISIQGRKVYLVPEAVNKRDAVLYVKERAQARFMVASGDSLLDLPMLECADDAIAPAHGEIYQLFSSGRPWRSPIHFTSNEGILASEEILNFAASIIDSRANSKV